MKIKLLFLLIVFVLLQYNIWIGKASWKNIWSLDKELSTQKTNIDELQARNNSMQAEIDDLKKKGESMEEVARKNLGYIKKGEVFYKVVK